MCSYLSTYDSTVGTYFQELKKKNPDQYLKRLSSAKNFTRKRKYYQKKLHIASHELLLYINNNIIEHNNTIDTQETQILKKWCVGTRVQTTSITRTKLALSFWPIELKSDIVCIPRPIVAYCWISIVHVENAISTRSHAILKRCIVRSWFCLWLGWRKLASVGFTT